MRGHGTGLSLDAGLAQTLSPQLGASDPTLQPRLCRILTGPPVLCPPGPQASGRPGYPSPALPTPGLCSCSRQPPGTALPAPLRTGGVSSVCGEH